MNMRRVVTAGALLVGLALSARAGDTPRSGPEVGSTVSAFDVHDVTGRFKGSKLCYV
jgi:hypothetical protein